jgi:hypothetical protein
VQLPAADKPPKQTMDHGYAFKKCMSHADQCVRLAGLTDDLIVRDQLLDLAQDWMLAARRARRSSDDAHVVPLHRRQRGAIAHEPRRRRQLIASKQSPCRILREAN